MNPDRQVEIDLFNAALEIESPVERARLLDQACANDAERRHRVEALLRSFECADAIFGGTETRPVASIENDPLTEGPGTCIGPYKLLQKIGEGGMGIVYMAQQEHPIQRKVALKIIKVGMDTRQVVARFEAERQALAMMDHPNIARVFDGGCTDSGRPYFVMELVQGVPITEFCDKNKLSPLERINLFIPVCRAIQSAHQKGIIHRDIKPSNVLVTLHHGEPMPKVIDFGVAKATNQKLTEKTLFTNYATMIGTPAYMSPEQAEMSSMDVDTRTDIYSLGVLLYELLTGTTPFDQKQLLSKGFGEMQRIIAEEEPQRPSIRASTMEAEKQTTVARNRRLASAALETALKGDLDWITMKCLEKDRRRRYETPNELIADLLKHLNHEPVSAAAPTVGYRMQKFYQRNRALVHAAVAIGIILVMATLISVSMAIRMSQLRNEALRAQKNAEIQAEIAEAVNKFLNEDLLEQADPWNEPDPEVKLRTVVDRAARSIEGKFKEQPLVEAAIRLTLSGIYRSLDDGEAARRHGNRAREIYERELGKEHPLTLKALLGLVGDLIQGAQTDHAKADEASALAEEVHSIANRMLGPEHAITLDALRKRAAALGESFRFKEQRTLLDDALARHERVLGKNRPETIELLIQSSENYSFFCENSKTVDQAKEAVARSEALRPDHPLRFAAKERLSRALGVRIGNWEERRRLAEETKEFAMRVFGPKHWKTLSALGACIEADISYPGAADLAAETLEYARKRFGPNDRRTLLVQRTVALIYSRNENRDRAEELYLSGLAILNSHFKPHDPIRLHYLIRTGYFYGGSGMGLPPVAEKMEPYYREAASVALAVYGEQSWPYLMALNSLRELYTRQKNWRAAAEVNEVLLRIEKRIDDNGVKGTTGTSMKLLQCLLALEENEKAGALLQSTLESFLDQPPTSTKEWEAIKPLLNAAEYYPGRQTLFSSFDKLFARPLESVAALEAAAQYHRIAEHWEQEHRCWQALTDRAPHVYEHWHARSIVAIQSGNTNDHFVCRRELLKRFGNATDNRTREAVLATWHLLPGKSSPEETAQVEALYQSLSEVAERDDRPMMMRAHNRGTLALMDLRRGQYAEALDHLTKANLDRQPPNELQAVRGRIVQSLAYAGLGELDKASEIVLSQSRRISIGRAYLWFFHDLSRLRCLWEQGAQATFRLSAERLGLRHPTTTALLESLCQFSETQRKTEAIEPFVLETVQAFAKNPAQSPADWQSLNTVLNAMKHFESPNRLLAPLRDIIPQDPSETNQLAVAAAFYSLAADWPSAHRILRNATREFPLDPLRWHHRSAMAIACGDIEDHVEAAQEILNRFSDSDDRFTLSLVMKTACLVEHAWPPERVRQILQVHDRLETKNEDLAPEAELWDSVNMALADTRLQRFTKALDHLKKMDNFDPIEVAMPRAFGLSVAALCYAHQGEWDKASNALVLSDEAIGRALPSKRYFDDVCRRDFLIKEARQIIARSKPLGKQLTKDNSTKTP